MLKHFYSKLPAVFTLVVLCVLMASPTFGQMGSYVTYSDMWIDDSAAPANAEFYEGSLPAPIYVVSCGVTQDSYNGYGHTYWVVSTLTSPNRNTSGNSYHTNGYSAYTRVDNSLLYDFNDLGNFTVNSNHWMCCPYMGGNPYTGAGCYPSSSSHDGAVAGASIVCYRLQSSNPATQIAILVRKENCVTYCGADSVTFHYSGSPPQILLGAEPYLRYGSLVVCSHLSAVMRVASCDCGDVEAPLCPIYPTLPICN